MKNFIDSTWEKLYLDWDREASIFWQEIFQYKYTNNKVDRIEGIKTCKSIYKKDSSKFWEELAMQRT